MTKAKLTSNELPIILVRGWGQHDIRDEQRLTYQGFNIGTVYPHKVGPNYIYEGLILKFLKEKDRQYVDATNVLRYEAYKQGLRGPDNSVVNLDEEVAKLFKGQKKSLWVYRYYDFAHRELEFYARQLLEVIYHVRKITGADKVNIIAHSMGGLITRWLLQKITKDEKGRQVNPSTLINKVVTLGTPHGGITFAKLAEQIDPGIEIKYFDEDFLVRELGNSRTHPRGRITKFDPRAMLCVAGCDHNNYGVPVVKSVVGSKSDGLVKQDNAYVKGAYRAFVHKCHGGNDSLVTSREAYELATRFFFGNQLVTIIQNRAEITGKYESWWQGQPEYFIGFAVKPRKLDFFLNEQTDRTENCYGPFTKNKIDKKLIAYQGFLDTAKIADPSRDNSVVFRFDIYVGERDTTAILGYSDTKILMQNAMFRYVMGRSKIEFYPQFFRDTFTNTDKKIVLDIISEEAGDGVTDYEFEEFEVDYGTYKAWFTVKVTTMDRDGYYIDLKDSEVYDPTR